MVRLARPSALAGGTPLLDRAMLSFTGAVAYHLQLHRNHPGTELNLFQPARLSADAYYHHWSCYPAAGRSSDEHQWEASSVLLFFGSHSGGERRGTRAPFGTLILLFRVQTSWNRSYTHISMLIILKYFSSHHINRWTLMMGAISRVGASTPTDCFAECLANIPKRLYVVSSISLRSTLVPERRCPGARRSSERSPPPL